MVDSNLNPQTGFKITLFLLPPMIILLTWKPGFKCIFLNRTPSSKVIVQGFLQMKKSNSYSPNIAIRMPPSYQLWLLNTNTFFAIRFANLLRFIFTEVPSSKKKKSYSIDGVHYARSSAVVWKQSVGKNNCEN